MATGSCVIGSTYKWSPTFYKNGTVYDLTGATITVSFRAPPTTSFPLGEITTGSMSIVSAAAGTATYTNLTTLFGAAGQWYRSYTVSVGGVVLQSPPIPFTVYSSTSAGFTGP